MYIYSDASKTSDWYCRHVVLIQSFDNRQNNFILYLVWIVNEYYLIRVPAGLESIKDKIKLITLITVIATRR